MLGKKKIIYLLLILILFGFLVWIIYCKGYGKRFFNDEMVVNYDISEILLEQEEVDHEIDEYLSSDEYTFENPKVIVNPYKISPLTALIIFKTSEEEVISVNINDEYNFSMNEDKEHIIPIYGLYDGKVNEIVLVNKEGNERKILIETEKSSGINDLVIQKTVFNNYNDLYFMTSPVGTPASAYDQKGNLKWYLTKRFTMDFEWLDNGHFLVGISNASVADRKIGFVEMDYLGKIYNYYVLEHGYEFEFQILNNGNYMLCGGEKAIFYDKAWIYEIDNQGNIIDYIDLYKIFKDIDPDFDDSRLNFRIIRNGFAYNEDTYEMIISLRGLNSVISVDYRTKKLNYIFAPSGVYSNKFDEYMVTLESGRYPLGIHSVILTKEGYVGFLNNGYDRYNGFEVGGDDNVSTYLNDYSTAELYEIKDKVAKLIWEYDAGKEIFTHQYGSFNIYNGNKLVDFGWTLNDEYRQREDATLSESEKNTDNTYAKIYEFDSNNEMVLEAKIEDGKYRIFKHGLYSDNINNFDNGKYNFYITMSKSEKEKVNIRKISDKLEQASEYKNTITYTKYSIDTDYNFDTYDEVDILLVGENNTGYVVNYKNSLENVKKNLNIELKHGNYALYLIINGVYYKTNVMVKY